MNPVRMSVLAALLASVLGGGACTERPAVPTTDPAAVSGLTPVLSVKELMDVIVDPIADWVFDAAVIDVSEAGVTESMPLTDEDWLHVERGTLILAESANLLKMPRAMVPSGDDRLKAQPGGPELTPAEIEAKIDADRGLWNAKADELRTAALDSLAIVRAREPEGLFDAGDKIDKACESCHLEFWYPGDKAAVLEDQKKRATYGDSAP